jgi:hypothetical protein
MKKRMIKRISIKEIILVAMFILISISGNGQDKINTPAAYEQMKHKSQWQNSSNSAGLLLDKPIDYTEISTSYTSYGGSFHRPQEGERGNDLNFDAEGAVFVGKVYAWGKFNYTRKTIEDADFNASILDPFRGMPYMVADTNRSEWQNQVYDMSLKVVAPILPGRWSLGLEAGYKAISGAKQRDPRTENYYYTVQVKPGIVYSINNQHHIGVNFDYFNLKEESNMSKVNTYVDQQYYEMYGLGTSVQRIGTGRTTNYTGNNVGGGIQYNYQGIVNILFSSDYAYKVEDVELGFSDAADDSGVKDKKWNTKLQLSTNQNKLTHFLTLAYNDWRIDGIECITQYDNTAEQNGYVTLLRDIRSKYKIQTATLDYDVSLNRDDEYDWKAGLSVNYINKDDIYLSPRSQKASENMAFQVRLKKNLALSQGTLQRRILLGADYCYNNNLSGKYNYNGSHPEYSVVTKFEQIDSDYLNSNFWSVGGVVTYSQKIKENRLANLFAKAEFRYTEASGSQFGNRHYLQMSIGCNF